MPRSSFFQPFCSSPDLSSTAETELRRNTNTKLPQSNYPYFHCSHRILSSSHIALYWHEISHYQSINSHPTLFYTLFYSIFTFNLKLLFSFIFLRLFSFIMFHFVSETNEIWNEMFPCPGAIVLSVRQKERACSFFAPPPTPRCSKWTAFVSSPNWYKK